MRFLCVRVLLFSFLLFFLLLLLLFPLPALSREKSILACFSYSDGNYRLYSANSED